jgi:hypothetical protein
LNRQRTKDTEHGKSLWKPRNLGALGDFVVRTPEFTQIRTGSGHEPDLGQGIEMCPHPGPLPEYWARVKERDGTGTRGCRCPELEREGLQMLIQYGFATKPESGQMGRDTSA